MKTILLLAIFALTACSSGPTGVDDDPADSVEPGDAAESTDAAAKLKKIGIYAFGGIGIAGTLSEGEKLYSAVISQDGAKSDFLDIAKNGTIEAKMYAMHGLAKIAPAEFARLRPSFDEKDEVKSMSGCIIWATSTGEILDGIEKNLARN